jgi:hypothetical protein
MKSIEELLKILEENPELIKVAAEGFKERLEAREEEFKIQAKKRAPDQEFLNRAYDI